METDGVIYSGPFMEPPIYTAISNVIRRRLDAFSAALLCSELAAETSLQDAFFSTPLWADLAVKSLCMFQWILYM